MKISNDTLDVLKNYATINSNILIHPGKLLRTIGPQSNIFAEAMVKEEFPVEIVGLESLPVCCVVVRQTRLHV